MGMNPTAAVGGLINKADVKAHVNSYEKYHTDFGGSVEARKKAYADMVNKYYDLATSFYEYGWGTSFHFAHRTKGETLLESIKRHEHYLASKLGLNPGHKVLDVGCGVGGPMRQIATFSGATITGLNNNAYQITRGNLHNKREGVKTCDFLKADFMNIPMKDGHYDAIYEIDATCHAPDAVACYKEIYRVLKPGGCFAGYEWCLTDHYNEKLPAHVRAKEEIEIGNGLPEVRTTRQVIAALKTAGFEVVEFADLAEPQPHLAGDVQLPWWEPLDGQGRFMALTNFRTTWLGRFITRNLVWWLELLRLAPRGSCQVSSFLEKGADGLCAGGRMGIFTPVFFFLVRKPLKK